MSWDFFEEKEKQTKRPAEEKVCNRCKESFNIENMETYYGRYYCVPCFKEKKKRKKKKQKSKEKVPDKKIAENIKVPIGKVNLSFKKQNLIKMVQKIWKLDNLKNPELDKILVNEFKNLALQNKLRLNIPKIFKKVEKDAYFKPSEINSKKMGKEMFSYNDWQREFKKYTGVGKIYQFSRTEFSKFLTNKFKNHWVDRNGKNLPEEQFQMLRRGYRERKGMERFLGFIEEEFFNYVREDALSEFLRQMRILICKVVKDDLLQNV